MVCPTHNTVNVYGKGECLRCKGGMMWDTNPTHSSAYFRNHGGSPTDYCIRSQGWSSSRYTRDPKRLEMYSSPEQAAELLRRWRCADKFFGKWGMQGYPRATVAS